MQSATKCLTAAAAEIVENQSKSLRPPQSVPGFRHPFASATPLDPAGAVHLLRQQYLAAQVDSWPAPSAASEADGPATIESYTVVHGKSGPSHAVVVGRLDGTGERFLANTHDEDDPLGAPIHVRSFEYGNRVVFARPSR